MHPPIAFVGVDDGAELGLVVLAMFAILILAGLYLISQMFSAAFKKIPVVGPPIGAAFDWVTRWARGAMMATFHGLLWACGKIAHAFMALIRNLYEWNLQIVRDIIDAAEHTRFTVIPREITAARQFAMNQANQVYYQARAYTNQEIARVDKSIADLKAWTSGRLLALQNTLVTLVNDTRQILDARISKIQADLTAQIQTLTRKEQADFATAEADARQLATQAEQQAVKVTETWANDLAHNAWAAQWAEITAGVTAVLTQLQTDHPDLARQLKLIIAVEPATLAEAEAAAAAAVPPMLTALAECVIPDCQDLNQLRNTLHALGDIALFAAFLAWLIQMVTDPVGWARETYAVLGPVVDGELAVVKGILGL